MITLLFGAIFKVLPDAKIAWSDVRVGAVVTALLFVAGKFALGLYLGRSNPGEAFGAAGALALMLVWIYYSSMIVLLGAEFTQAWAEHRGQGDRARNGERCGWFGRRGGWAREPANVTNTSSRAQRGTCSACLEAWRARSLSALGMK